MLASSDGLNDVGCSASSAPELGLEVPGAQRAEGVVGQGQVGVRLGDRRAGVGEPRRGGAYDVRDLVVDLEARRRGPPSTPPAARRAARASSGGANAAPGSPSACGARGSGPASTDSSSARSPTLRAIGPPTDVLSHWL